MSCLENILQIILGIPQSSSPSVNLTPESMHCIQKRCVKNSPVGILLPPVLRRGAKIATMKRLTHAGEECHKVLKAFVHSKCFADCRIHHNNLGRVLSLQFCSEMIWPGLLCKTVTELRLESWIPESSPGDVGGTSIFSFRAAVMMPLCCPELAALEQKGCFYCQILPIKKSLVYHPAVVCLLSSVL